jgi:hypothetical protein
MRFHKMEMGKEREDKKKRKKEDGKSLNRRK